MFFVSGLTAALPFRFRFGRRLVVRMRGGRGLRRIGGGRLAAPEQNNFGFKFFDARSQIPKERQHRRRRRSKISIRNKGRSVHASRKDTHSRPKTLDHPVNGYPLILLLS